MSKRRVLSQRPSNSGAMVLTDTEDVYANLLPEEKAQTIRDLIARIKQGNRDALETLIARHQGWIYNIALRMVYNRQDAEDATQEILVRVVTRLSRFDFQSRLKTWVVRVAIA